MRLTIPKGSLGYAVKSNGKLFTATQTRVGRLWLGQ